MMSKLSRIAVFLTVFVLAFTLSTESQAFFLFKILKAPAPVIPMPDFADEAAQILDATLETAATAQKTITNTKATITNINQAKNSVFNFNFTSLVDGKVNPGQLEIEACKVKDISVDIYDRASIETAVQKLFFQYPSADITEKQVYEEQARNFYEDSLVEIYTASRQLQQDVIERVDPTLEEAEKCLKDGGCGIPAANGNSESAYNTAKALESIDNLLESVQKAVALKAQLRAAKSILETEPAKYEPDSQKVSSLGLKAHYTVSSSRPLAFAQMDVESAAAAVEEAAVLQPSQGQAFINKTLSFSIAPETDYEHPFTTAGEKLDELAKLEPINEEVTVAVNAHNMIRELESYRKGSTAYQEAVDRHKQIMEALYKSNQCTIAYLERRFMSPEQVWSGNALMPETVNAHELRTGISAWALDSYEAAKAAQTISTSADDVITPAIDADNEAYSDITNPDAAMDAMDSQGTLSGSPEKQEQMLEEGRAADMLPWQIGAETAKSMVNQASKWGTLKTEYPVWNDTKSFYNQYLRGKYDNIKTYLKGFTAGDIIALILAEKNGLLKNPEETQQQKQLKELDDSQTVKEQQLAADRANKEKAYTAQADSALQSLQNRRDTAAAELEAASARYKELSDELADFRQQLQDQAVEKLDETVAGEESFRHTDINTADKLRENIKAEANNEEDLRKEKQLEQQLEDQNQKVRALKAKVKDLDDQIAKQKLASQEQSAAINNDYAASLLNLQDEGARAKSAVEESFAKAADAELDSLTSSLAEQMAAEFELKNPGKLYDGPTAAILSSGLRKAVNKALGDLYEKVDARIEQAQKELSALGDGLYRAENHPKIVDIHQRMINDIKALPLIVNYRLMNIASTIQLYARLIPADISPEQKDFFVGSPAKARDLRAPRVILTFNLPPLREIVHFDAVDFQNVKPYNAARKKSGTILKKDFLSYGGEIPQIWEYMLKDKAFVEKDFKLKEALNTGCSEVAFFRGGFMPCRVKDAAHIVDINEDGEFIRGSTSSGLTLFECPNFEMRSGEIYDMFNDVSIKLGFGKKAPAADCAYSELGTLLDADKNNNIFFRQKVYDAFRAIIEQEQNAEQGKELSNNQKRRLSAYSQAVLADNQVGDFLKMAESEQNARKQLEQVKASSEEMKNNLKESLQRFGFEPPSDLDLSREDDYNMVRGRLDRLKNQKIAAALKKIADVDVTDNPVAEERVDRMKKLIAALQKDKDEVMVITAAVIEDNNFDEELKSAAVDKQASDRYQESVDKIKNESGQMSGPYCATY